MNMRKEVVFGRRDSMSDDLVVERVFLKWEIWDKLVWFEWKNKVV